MTIDATDNKLKDRSAETADTISLSSLPESHLAETQNTSDQLDLGLAKLTVEQLKERLEQANTYIAELEADRIRHLITVDPEAMIQVDGWDYPTSYGDMARLEPKVLWNRYVCGKPWPDAKAAFMMARALPFAAQVQLASESQDTAVVTTVDAGELLSDNVPGHEEAQLVPKWVGEFSSFQDWVNRASRALTGRRDQAICVDAMGRRCGIGADFMRARDEDSFPVRYFWECELAPVKKIDGGGK